MKAVSLLVNSYLPDDLKDYSQVYDSKSINRILYAVALKHPEMYASLEKKIGDIGRNASYINGETITLGDLEPVIDRKSLYDAMDAEIKELPRDRNFINNRREIFQKYNNIIEKETAKAGLAKRNNIAMSVLSGARGKNPQFKAMVSTPGTYSDYKGEPVDVFSKESFADGIRPAMFCASTNGTRASVVSAKCLSEDTLVRMADMSERRIADIRVGDKVLGSDKEGHLFPVEVINVFDNGIRDCYKYKFEFSSCHGGSSCSSDVVCTEDHKFLMVSSSEYSRKKSLYSRGNGPKPTWEDLHNKRVLPAGKMHRGARVSVCNPLYPQGGFSGSVDEPWARIIGLLIGDGCLTCGSATLLSCADDALIDDIREELRGLGHKVIKSKSEGFSWHITRDGYNPLHNNSIVKGVRGFVKGSKCSRNAMLAEYGLLGKYSYEKRLPVGWHKWTAESICRMLAGLFAADGSVYKTKNAAGRTQVSVDLITTSKHLAEDVRLALSTVCGITPRIENPAYSGGFAGLTKDMVRPIYTLCISRAEDVLKFNDVIGRYIPGVKRGKLARLCGDIVIKQHNPYAKHMFLSKEHVGEVRCFDIEVDHPDHLFVLANGLITSNSSTAKGGDWAKQMAAISANQMIREQDCGTTNGISLPIDDSSIVGRKLAKDAGKFKAGEFVTREMLASLSNDGVKNVVVRSALTCGTKNGLCAHCIGKFYNGGKLSKIGDAVGLVSSTSSSEPVTQLALCLEEHTLVRMADGTAKEIKDIEPGDKVLGADKESNTFPVTVLDKFDQGIKTVSDYVFRRGQTSIKAVVTATEDHKFLLNRRVSSAWNIEHYGKSCGADPYKLEVIPIKKANKSTYAVFPSSCRWEGKDVDTLYAYMLGKIVGAYNARQARCYDIEVDHPDHLFVLANGLITSNSAKHTAGMTKDKRTFSGLPVIQQFTQSPEKFKDRATLSEVDGKVDSVEDAPQGGTYVTVAGRRHYVLPGHDVEVKAGDTVEAGDELSEGLADAEDIVRLKGLGAGRKYYADRLSKILEDSGAASDRRNIEIIARGAVNHVRITGNDSVGAYLPDDVVDYNALQATYKAPDSSARMAPSQAVGKYIQEPVLHYSIGTRVTPNVAKDLKDNGYDSVLVDQAEPGFEPEMVRLRTASHNNRDWLASQATSYLTQQIEDSVVRGDDTNVIANDDYRPRIAYGRGFAENVETTGRF